MDVDALFEEDPKTFVAARDRLAKELRAAGQRDEAAEVRALRRPSVSAWGLNQVARRDASTIEELLASIERARVAQDEVLAGAARKTLRDAMTARRQALGRVIDRARAVIEESGRPSDASARDIESALQGSMTPAFTDSLRRGVLIDLDTGAADEDSLSELLGRSVGTDETDLSRRYRQKQQEQREKRDAELARLRAELHEAAASVAKAASAVAERERELHDARDTLEEARRAHDRAAAALEQVESED